ncbi:MAG: AAA family ATPase [Elusimicrobiales bacterium]
MYEKFWGLKLLPFENTPDPRNFIASEKHIEALSRLMYAVQEKRACALMAGTYGCGKTLVLRRLRFELEPKGCKFAFVNNPRLSALDILRAILHGFTEEEPPSSKYDVLARLENELSSSAEEGRHCVIMVDEAHSINDIDIFEELRLLLNFQTDSDYLLTLIFSGQNELWEMVERNKQLNQRVAIKCGLVPLSQEGTGHYIRGRLIYAGGDQNIFSEDNIAAIARMSGGIPRSINNICHLALLNASMSGAKTITEALLADCSEEASPK